MEARVAKPLTLVISKVVCRQHSKWCFLQAIFLIYHTRVLFGFLGSIPPYVVAMPFCNSLSKQ